MCSIRAVGLWPATLGCILVGVDLNRSKIPLPLPRSRFVREALHGLPYLAAGAALGLLLIAADLVRGCE